MSASKALLLLCCVLSLSACGSSQSAQPAATQQAQAPPAIQAIDEPAPDAGWTSPLDDPATASIHVHWCLRFGDSKTDNKDTCTPTPDEMEKSIQMQQMFEQAVQPATGTEPRAIAQLRLPARGPKARVRLAVWRDSVQQALYPDRRAGQRCQRRRRAFGAMRSRHRVREPLPGPLRELRERRGLRLSAQRRGRFAGRRSADHARRRPGRGLRAYGARRARLSQVPRLHARSRPRPLSQARASPGRRGDCGGNAFAVRNQDDAMRRDESPGAPFAARREPEVRSMRPPGSAEVDWTPC